MSNLIARKGGAKRPARFYRHSRTGKASIPLSSKFPMLGLKFSKLAELIVTNANRRLGRLGKYSIAACVQTMFWVVALNATIKRIISKCVVCKKYNTETNSQKMADLSSPRFREYVQY